MKNLLALVFCLSPFFCFSQAVSADPALEPMKITSLTNNNILAQELPLNGIIKLKVPFLNKNITTGLPSGTCKIKISLGSKIILDPSFNLQLVNTSNFFEWTAISSGGQVQITGELTGALPANFSDTAYFNVKGMILGSSTITTNFLVTNHNTQIILSDENGTNNVSSIAYTIINVVPITFTNFTVQKQNCSVKAFFDAENEINVDRFELEVSDDLMHFEKAAVVKAGNLKHYSFRYDLPQKYQIEKIFFRIKAIDIDGQFGYTEIKKISGICSGGIVPDLNLFPNPVPKNINLINIEKSKGLFNSSYTILITDIAGRVYETKVLHLLNAERLNLEINNLAPGTYFVKISDSADNYSTRVLKFIKL
jgi:hypothetical protein